ncbi:MAG: PEGA domain-containing protein [Terriglobales bacterium]
MKRARSLVFILVLMGVALPGGNRFAAAQTPWQYGRIESVQKSVSTSTKVWIVNTPLEEERTNYRISVHVQDRIIAGAYEHSATEAEPPPEWVPGYAVQLEIMGDSLYLRSPTGSVRLHISQRKAAGLMKPITADEKKRMSELNAAPEAPESIIGFSKSGSGKAAAPEAAPPPPLPPPAPSTGLVMVRSTPFLSEVFVDGASMGYTPAKIALAPGKHTFRVEKPGYKPWAKEMTITVGSELTLDATLDRR